MSQNQSRFPSRKVEIEISELDGSKNYEVNFKLYKTNDLLEIEGSLIPFNDGRKVDYKFDPSYYSDSEAKFFFEENWEDIEEEIVDSLYSRTFS